MERALCRRPVRTGWLTASSVNLSIFPRLAKRLQASWPTNPCWKMLELCEVPLVAVVHDSSARSKSNSKTNQDCRTSPVVFFCQHEAGGSAGQVAIVFQD